MAKKYRRLVTSSQLKRKFLLNITILIICIIGIGYATIQTALTINGTMNLSRVVVMAENVSYDNTDSGMTATDVQQAIDEINDILNPPQPTTFADDDWGTIIKVVKRGDDDAYTVGDTKSVDMGALGTHTLRVANNSTPAACETTGFSQTACGFVLEFADIITTHVMNDTATNVGGWPATSMRTYLNSDIYNALPTALKNAIIDTTVVSGHGETSGETNFTSTDKLYLLSPMEVWGKNSYSQYDSARDLSRQLDYYSDLGVNNISFSGAIKQYNSSNTFWWLRSAYPSTMNYFNVVTMYGDDGSNLAYDSNAVSPAFRIG